MNIDKSLSFNELQRFGAVDGDVADQTRALLKQQKSVWQQLADGYKSLDTVRTRVFDFDSFSLKIQFNPGRITSSSAKVDKKSIKERKCFLCLENLPPDQRGISYNTDYLILCNPFPIFPEHFTIPHIRHIAQLIKGAFDVLLDLSKDMGKYYTVFYNGPGCGASAPDHLHFQAGNKGFMLIEKQFDPLKKSFGTELFSKNELHIFAIDDTLRRFISIESSNKNSIETVFDIFYSVYERYAGNDEEPMLNIISSYDISSGIFRILLIPRGKHRPSFYYSEGDDKILLSPASVDFGGVLITPVEKDFNRLTKEHIVQTFNEVSIDRDAFRKITTLYKEELKNYERKKQ